MKPDGTVVWLASTTTANGVKSADVTIAGVETVTFATGKYPSGKYTLRVVNHTYNSVATDGACDAATNKKPYTLTATVGAKSYPVTATTGPDSVLTVNPFDALYGDDFFTVTIP
jgi:hypothetical protein